MQLAVSKTEQSLFLTRLFCCVLTLITFTFIKNDHMTIFVSGYTCAHFVGSLVFGKKYIKIHLSTSKGILKLLAAGLLAFLMLKINFPTFILLLILHFTLSETFVRPASRSDLQSNMDSWLTFAFYFSAYFFILRSSFNSLLASHHEFILIPLFFSSLLFFRNFRKNLSDIAFLVPTIFSIYWHDNFGPAIFYHVTTWLLYPKFLNEFKGVSLHLNDILNLGISFLFLAVFFALKSFQFYSSKELYQFSTSLFIVHAAYSFLLSDLNPKFIKDYLVLS